MIVDAIQNLAQLLAKSPASSAVGGEPQAAYQLQLTPSQQVQAEVLASLPNQRFLARIAGELFRIELPIIVQPGETFQMTVVTGEPNLTFTPDNKWIVFRSNMHGPTHVYAVEIAKAK